jgi:hydrogenase maturation factor
MGIPKNSIIQYKTAVKSGKYVLIAHGFEMETLHAREIHKLTDHDLLAEHQPKRISNEASVMTA